MERELAERLLAVIDSLSPGLDRASAITLEMDDKDEAKLLRGHLGHIMSGPLFDLVMHVVRQYPDLDPDKNRPPLGDPPPGA